MNLCIILLKEDCEGGGCGDIATLTLNILFITPSNAKSEYRSKSIAREEAVATSPPKKEYANCVLLIFKYYLPSARAVLASLMSQSTVPWFSETTVVHVFVPSPPSIIVADIIVFEKSVASSLVTP